MSTALHLNLCGNNYFDKFDKAQTYINAAANNSDGFKLLYNILEIIHQMLRISKGRVHKTIVAPAYTYVEDDNIYTYITRYKNFLLYEGLSPEKRSYNKQEQAMFVFNALSKDKRFKNGLVYVEATIQAWQHGTQLAGATRFTLDLEMDKIAVTIDERSEEYKVGTQITTPIVK